MFVVTDENVKPKAEFLRLAVTKNDCRSEMQVLPPGEEQKSLASLALLYDTLADARADRQTLVLAVGGGVIGDLAGFAAATFNRGLPLLMVPTTLLAMVDSSVGGKTGINHPRAKNLIGAFHQPIGVWIDTAMLDTLPEREFQSGLAEVVKYGVALDAAFFAWLEGHVAEILARDPAALRHVVARSCQIKASVVEKDERELTGLRRLKLWPHVRACLRDSGGLWDLASWRGRRRWHGLCRAAGSAASPDRHRHLRAPNATPQGVRLAHEALGWARRGSPGCDAQ